MNGSHFVTLDAPPTPVEFARLVQISRPVLINGTWYPFRRNTTVSRTQRAGHTVPGTNRWSNDYLSRTMSDRLVSVAVTPDGYVFSDCYGTCFCSESLHEVMQTQSRAGQTAGSSSSSRM